MDWAHFVLGALALVLIALIVVRRRRELHVRIDYREESKGRDRDDSAR